VPAPRKVRGIRDDNVRVDTVFPPELMQRVDRVAKYLSLTRRGAMIILMDEACSHYERRQEDARQANGNHHA
jgi:hypothetical protein